MSRAFRYSRPSLNRESLPGPTGARGHKGVHSRGLRAEKKSVCVCAYSGGGGGGGGPSVGWGV
eukprot:12923130-Prorocentrum_lima.AAC.1